MVDVVVPKPATMLKLVFILFLVPSSSVAFGGSEPKPIANQHAERKLSFDDKATSILIDCGADNDDFIDTGVKWNISSEFSTYADPKGQTLRSFPNGIRNCYTLDPDGANINKKYLVRASFLYGNYDHLNKIPKFDLHIGVNKWITVDLANSSTYRYYEIIYVSSTEYADVCLVNTDSGVPFISSLELKVLDDSVYKIDSGSSLLHERRYDAGADSSPTQAEDKYGRDWYPLPRVFDSYWVHVSTDEPIQSGSFSDPNEVPHSVWRTAVQPPNTSMPLYYRHHFQDDSIHQCHLYLYFAEIDPGRAQREMTVRLNRDSLITRVKLELSPTTVTIGPLKTDATKTIEFQIESVEPDVKPILNAFEIFTLNELPNRPTDTKDVDAMMEIKNTFKVARNWQGDPCVPSNLSWQGVNCSAGDPPRVISLDLSNSHLMGNLPPALSNLTALQSLDLSYNNLTGSVPSELKKMFKDLKLLRLEGNDQLCQSESCSKKPVVVPVVAAIVSFLFIVVIVGALAIFLRNKRKLRELKSKKGSLKSKNRQFSYSEIVGITSNFKNAIGVGGFGNVYQGVLTDNTQVAVKMLSRSSNQGSKEFQAEAQLLMVVHHRNLVSLVGYCNEGEHMGLIYEYMANGNLQQHLTGTTGNFLNWRERLQIAISSAQGLEYLHNGCKPPIVHRDLKPSNILLDEHMQAKIADFGLSRAFSTENESYMTNPAGTLGYLDPEHQLSGNLNTKFDVYSFGIILFQLITGKPVITRDPERQTHILHWVGPIIKRGDIRDIVDPRIHEQFNSNAAWKAVEVAMSCVEPASQRPDMNHVLAELKEALELEMSLGRTMTMESKNMRSTDYSFGMNSMEFHDDITTPQAR